MRKLSGPLLVATGVLDILYVLVSYSRQFAAIFQEGLVDAVEVIPAQLDRETAFWHLMFGATFVVLGGLVRCAQSRTGTLPAFLGWSLLALGLFGAILFPVSGFWLVLLLALLVLLAARRGATAEKPAPTREDRRMGGRRATARTQNSASPEGPTGRAHDESQNGLLPRRAVPVAHDR